MLPDDDVLWKCKSIYEMLLDPLTTTVNNKYLPTILETELNYCKKKSSPLSIVIIDIPTLVAYTDFFINAETYGLIRRITYKIKEKSNSTDLIFYNGRQTFLFLSPKSDKIHTHELVNGIEADLEQIYLNNTPLTIKGGYAEFPTDADSPNQLQDCAQKALSIANTARGNRIIGYFLERRQSARIPLFIEVRYAAAEWPERLTCSRNISETGIMLNGMNDLKLYGDIKLRFELPNLVKTKITVPARTAWFKAIIQSNKMDIGMFFTRIEDSVKEQIKAIISNFPFIAKPPITHL